MSSRALVAPSPSRARAHRAPTFAARRFRGGARAGRCPRVDRVDRVATRARGDDLDPDVPTPGFASVESALEDVRRGKFVVVLDDEDRENEGDLIGAADKMTAESMAFMIRHTS